MFGFLIGNEVRDDAVRLKMLADKVCEEILPLTHEKRSKYVELNFIQKDIGEDGQSFLFSQLPTFIFDLRSSPTFSEQLMIRGVGKYAGFSMACFADGKTHCSATDGIGYVATGGAKKLASVMSKKFGILDVSRYLQGI
jgi:hypothetical protein